MSDKFLQIFYFVRYLMVCKTAHGIHSPLIWDLYHQVLHAKKLSFDPCGIELQRALRRNDGRQIHYRDAGAGGKQNTLKSTTIKALARKSLQNPKAARMLANLAHHLNAARIAELGTSLGITTAYLAKSNPHAQIYSIDAVKELHDLAKESATTLGIKNIHLISGRFDEVLPQWLESQAPFDLVFIDGNHRLEASLNYYTLFRKHSPQAVIVIDDIRWSAEMREAWRWINLNENHAWVVDLFRMGLIYPAEAQSCRKISLWW